ncbi:MAG: hypothetical protein ABSB68_00745, partial [Acidimicrobiales bacterium]
QAVVWAGFSIDSEDFATLSRRVSGAKRKFYNSRGAPQHWEIKSSRLVTPNPWKRANNRNFAAELVRILRGVGATTYSVTMNKPNMINPMTLAATTPLQLQCLVEHFDAECRSMGRIGLVVADWSAPQSDHHASQCVASYVVAHNLRVNPCVLYASSLSNPAIQVADAIAAVRRRVAEGDTSLVALETDIQAVISMPGMLNTYAGRPFSNKVTMF